MFNKLHNGNTEALPLIRKEKTIAVLLSFFSTEPMTRPPFGNGASLR